MGISSICMDYLSRRKLLEVIGGDLRPQENRTMWLYRIAKLTGLHYRVIRAVWHGETLSQETLRTLKQSVRSNDDYLVERLLWDAELLNQVDPELYRSEIDYRRQLADTIRRFSDRRSK
jgi:hypothetical protein